MTKDTPVGDRNHSRTITYLGIVTSVDPATLGNCFAETGREPRLVTVSRVRVTVAVGAVLLWAVAPVMACLLPCLTTAHAKQDCSHHMAMPCGHATITAARTCCQVSSPPMMARVENDATQSQKRALDVVALVAHTPSSLVVAQWTASTFFESPPSEDAPHSFSVLRI